MGTFGQRLRELRKQRGISQNELSKHIGVSKSSVNMYERDEREPGFETLEAIADFFNVNMDYLLGRSSLDHIVDNFDPTQLSNPAKQVLIKILLALGNDDEEIFAHLAEEMSANFTLSDLKYTATLFDSLYTAFIEAGLDSNNDAETKEYLRALLEDKKRAERGSTPADTSTGDMA